MAKRPFGTCFFESYAQISLAALLGHEYDCLVNIDRPDLQSNDGHSLGIEVTRAMEESTRIARYPISQDNRKAFYSEAIRRQNEISELG